MTKDNIVKGGELMVFQGTDGEAKSIAFATSHTLTLTGETVDISCKDFGEFSATEVNKITWEIQTENLYSDTAYDELFTSMLNKTELTLVFGHASTATYNDGNGLVGEAFNPEVTAKKYYTGKAVITSLTVNAANGENATFSCTFSGVGKIEQKAAA